MTKPDDNWLRTELEALTPEELDRLRLLIERRHRVPTRKGQAVDHIDGDPTNNDPSNLRVVNIRENSKR